MTAAQPRAILNEEVRPSPAEIEHGCRVVAITVDGKTIDVPVVERARLLGAREEAISARETRLPAMASKVT